MRNRSAFAIGVAATFIVIGLVTSVVRSQDAAAPAAAPAADKKTPTPDEMMQAWAKYGTPGKEHEIFKSLTGRFDADVTMQMPGAPAPDKSTGTANNESIFDGRYLHGEFRGTMMGKPFKGNALWAFDKIKGKYVNLWIDDMSTMVMIAEGTADSSGKVLTLTTTCHDPLAGKDKTIRTVLTVVDNDHHTYEAFETPEGKEVKTLSIQYTRAK
jgi:hypothetical protein